MKSLQDTFAPHNQCFGCGPSNLEGLQIKSFVKDDYLYANFTSKKHHQAFDNILSGGICSTLLDCHSNWCAAYSIMQHTKSLTPPATVTAKFTIDLLLPTPMDHALELKAWHVESSHKKALIQSYIMANGKITARFEGIFVAVSKEHVAFNRW